VEASESVDRIAVACVSPASSKSSNSSNSLCLGVRVLGGKNSPLGYILLKSICACITQSSSPISNDGSEQIKSLFPIFICDTIADSAEDVDNETEEDSEVGFELLFWVSEEEEEEETEEEEKEEEEEEEEEEEAEEEEEDEEEIYIAGWFSVLSGIRILCE